MPLNIVALDRLLICPYCKRPLVEPTTLQCAHTVCSIHARGPTCPVPDCLDSSSSRSTSSPHPTPSGVSYFLPPLPIPPIPYLAQEQNVDVSVNKILALLMRERHRIDTDHVDSDPDQLDLLQHLREQRLLQRMALPDVPLADFDGPSNAVPFLEKELLSELTCQICYTLFYEPVTTPCQHTFCSRCLHRSLDHSISCPLCRRDIHGFTYFQDHPCNKLILSIILETFPERYHERGNAIEAEERSAGLDTPIFVGQLSFPGIPTLLHLFEPRYRLMLRRCVHSDKPRFGMIMPSRGGSSQLYDGDWGTMLEIRSYQMLPDGRSMVETWGTQRFRVLEHGTLDGYMVGRIEIIEDYEEDSDDFFFTTPIYPTFDHASTPSASSSQSLSLTPSTSTSPTASSTSPSHSHYLPTPHPSIPISHPSRTTLELMTICRHFLLQMSQGTAPWVVQRLNDTYGSPPTDPSHYSFWVALVLPIDDREKAKLLPIRSAKLRLRLVVHWIEQLQKDWWFTTGCIIV